MNWLVVKHKDGAELFLQSRIERDLSNSVLSDIGSVIKTIVVAKFPTKKLAEDYILAWNIRLN